MSAGDREARAVVLHGDAQEVLLRVLLHGDGDDRGAGPDRVLDQVQDVQADLTQSRTPCLPSRRSACAISSKTGSSTSSSVKPVPMSSRKWQSEELTSGSPSAANSAALPRAAPAAEISRRVERDVRRDESQLARHAEAPAVHVGGHGQAAVPVDELHRFGEGEPARRGEHPLDPGRSLRVHQLLLRQASRVRAARAATGEAARPRRQRRRGARNQPSTCTSSAVVISMPGDDDGPVRPRGGLHRRARTLPALLWSHTAIIAIPFPRRFPRDGRGRHVAGCAGGERPCERACRPPAASFTAGLRPLRPSAYSRPARSKVDSRGPGAAALPARPSAAPAPRAACPG